MKFAFSISFLVLASCGAYEPDHSLPILDGPAGYGKKFFYLEALCDIDVQGIGKVDVEDEYIAGVISCENPNAPFQALKAQAVQARTFLYYKKFVEGVDVIRNSQSDQVFRCAHSPNGPSAEHQRAARETRGQYLSWSNEIIASFYVAGTIPPNPDPNAPFASCEANGGRDPTNTEKWVTYNKGKTNCDVEMTRLGFRTADCNAFPYNRGCASQNGQSCLASVGIDYSEQFAVYYGDDIKLETADGMCGGVIPDPMNMYDAFCNTKTNGNYCFDNTSLIVCLENLSDRVETCSEGCSNDACQSPVAATFCTGQADGEYCDQNRSVNCVNEKITSSEVCSSTCENGACSQPSENFCAAKADNSYCDNNARILCADQEISSSQVCEFGCSKGSCANADGNGEDAELITSSEGIVGGCSSTPARPSLFFLLALATLFVRKRKKV